MAAVAIDPTTIAHLLKTCYEVGQFLYKVNNDVKQTNRTLKFIETEFAIFQDTVHRVSVWLNRQSSSGNGAELHSVDRALGLINESMEDLRKTLAKVTRAAGDDAIGTLWGERLVLVKMQALYMMYEGSLKTHLATLRQHIQLLQTALHTSHFHAMQEQGTAFEEVAERALTIRRAHTKAKQKQRARRAAASLNAHDLDNNTILPDIHPVQPAVYEFVASHEEQYHAQGVSTQKRRATAQMGTMKGLAKALKDVLDADDSDLGDYGSDSLDDDMSSEAEKNQSDRRRGQGHQDKRGERYRPIFAQGNEGPLHIRIREGNHDALGTQRQDAREDPYESPASDINDIINTRTSERSNRHGPRHERDWGNHDGGGERREQGSIDTKTTNSPEIQLIPRHSHGPVDTLVDPRDIMPTESVPAVFNESSRFKLVEPPGQRQPSTDTLDTTLPPGQQMPTDSHYTNMVTLANHPEPKHYASSVFSRSSTLSGDTMVSPSTAVTSPSSSDAPSGSRTSIRRKPVQSTKSQDSFLSPSRISMQGATFPGTQFVLEPVASPASSTSNPLANHFAQSRHPSWSPRSMSDTYPVKSAASSTIGPDLSPQQSFPLSNRSDYYGPPSSTRVPNDEQSGLIPVDSELDKGAGARTPKESASVEASPPGNESVIGSSRSQECALDQVDANRMSALHHAAAQGQSSIVEVLIAKGAAVDVQGPDVQTPLHLAVRSPHVDVVILLLQRQANVNARDVSQRTPLHVCAVSGNVEVIKQLLDHGSQVESRDSSSKTALQLAVEAQQIDVVELLLDRSGYKPKDQNFQTAFFAAIETGNTRIAETFLIKGISCKALKNDAHKPAILAATSGNLAMLDLVIKNKARLKEKDSDGWTALHYAAHHGHGPIVERLLEKDVPSKAVTPKKETPLHLSVKSGCFATTDVLLRGKNAAQVSSKDKDGQEPLHHAARGGNADIFSLLLAHNAKIDIKTPFGWAPVHIATAHGHIKIVEQCLARGVSIEEKLGASSVNKSHTSATVGNGYWVEARWPYPGSRPLHLSLEYGRDDMARFLVDKGATTDATCSEGWTPLHYAAFYGSPSSVELLIEKHAYPHAITDQGRTPLQLAVLRSEIGNPVVPEQQSVRVQQLLSEAMLQVGFRRRPMLKQMLSFKGKAAEDKIENLKAVAVAMDLMSLKPSLSRQGTQLNSQG